MMAAGRAAQIGASVMLLEKTDRPGRKLLLSGRGRCNLSNTASRAEFIRNCPGSGRFLHSTLSVLDSRALTDFFKGLGVRLKVESGGRVFPESDEASTVVSALREYCRRGGVSLRIDTPVRKIETSGGRVTGVISRGGAFIPGRAVILSTGGASFPGTGSTGDGYRMAAELGHKVNPIFPALVPLETAEDWVPALAGLSLQGVRVKALADGRALGEETGEVLFTHYGVSGPAILRLSRIVSQAIAEGQPTAVLSIDLKPDTPLSDLDQLIVRTLNDKRRRYFRNAFGDMFPRALIQTAARLSGISEDLPVHQITRLQRRRLAGLLKGLPLTVTGTRGFREAFISAGGVDVCEIDPRTMSSRIVQGLYFAGEIIDIDGYTGGFNLQAAFSTGFSAGTAAAREAMDSRL